MNSRFAALTARLKGPAGVFDGRDTDYPDRGYLIGTVLSKSGRQRNSTADASLLLRCRAHSSSSNNLAGRQQLSPAVVNITQNPRPNGGVVCAGRIAPTIPTAPMAADRIHSRISLTAFLADSGQVDKETRRQSLPDPDGGLNARLVQA